MELVSFDKEKNVIVKMTRQEFLDTCDILSAAADDFKSIDPGMLLVPEARVSDVTRQIHHVLKTWNERQYGKRSGQP